MNKHKFIFIAYVLAISILTVFIQSCAKSDLRVESNSGSELARFKRVLENARGSNQFGGRTIDCSNRNNPKDHAGIMHNLILEDLYNENYITDSIEYLIEGFELVSGYEVEESASFIVELFNHIDSLVYDEFGRYSRNFLNTLSSELPSNELEIMNEFFENVDGCDTLHLRISMALATEGFVITSTSLSSESKDRMLTTLSIYRHSTCFWDDKYDDQNNSLRRADVFDAMGEYIAQNCDCEPGVIEDGSDIYAFASLFSAVMVALTGVWL